LKIITGEYMTKALSSYPESERDAVAARRVARNTSGLGYLSAQDYLRKKDEKKAKKKVALPIESK
jgi:hypothetical protein